MSRINPCPFCGTDQLQVCKDYNNPEKTYVKCRHCNATAKESVWNNAPTEARITELENALNGMLAAYEYDGQGEGENVACWDARVALQVHGYNKTVKEIAKGEKE